MHQETLILHEQPFLGKTLALNGGVWPVTAPQRPGKLQNIILYEAFC